MYGHVGAVLGDKGRHVYTIEPTATVREAVGVMNEHGVGALLVVERERPAGIFTERDVLRRVVGPGLHAAVARVGEVMTTDLVTVSPQMRVEEAMAIVTNRRLRHLPVMEDGKIVGMLSSGDLMRWVSLHQEEHIRRMADYITGAEPVGASR
ncbi:MAG: CBS domain-containing protein [Hyphomicrobiales bacterium]